MTSFHNHICEHCGSTFSAQQRTKSKPQPKFCSMKCMGQARKGKPSANDRRVTKACTVCDKQYRVSPYRAETATACSNECRQSLHGETVAKHRKSQTSIYYVWSNMKARCTNSKHPSWKYYGGRGITVCKEWLESFENFYQYMGDPPHNLTIDRINNDGNYEPGNVRWADYATQSHNSRRWAK